MAVQRGQNPTGVRAVTTLNAIGGGGSQAVLIRADDGNRYWLKDLDNPQGSRVAITEQLVARIGEMVGVKVCAPALVDVPAELEGEVTQGRSLAAGWSHGSLHIEGVRETRALEHRGDDSNARHHAGFFALFDWLGGQDPQWLISGSSDNAYYSHDHGHYLPGGPNWTTEQLTSQAATPFTMPGDTADLDAGELDRVADAISGATAEDLEGELAKLPPEWPVSDAELDSVVQFALGRQASVAERVRSLIPDEDEQ